MTAPVLSPVLGPLVGLGLAWRWVKSAEKRQALMDAAYGQAAFAQAPVVVVLLGDTKAKIVANLPYNIATALLIDWLSIEPWPPWYDMMVLMFQREVAERIVAREDDEAYGRLAVLANWRAETKIMFDISPAAFVPQPKVTSSVVRLVPRNAPEPCDRRTLEQVAAAAFGQRRKMLRQSLKSLAVDPARLAAAADVDPTRRAETIPVSGFVAMARELTDIRTAKSNVP